MPNKSKYVAYPVSDAERTALERACQSASLPADDTDQDELVRAMEKITQPVSLSLQTLEGTLRHLIDETSSPGLVVLEGLPAVSDPRRLGLLIGWLLGNVAKYEGEGDFVIEIRDQGSNPGERPSFRNAREFFLHTDLSYVEEPPRFFLLHSIANDPTSGGYSEFCKIADALDGMSNLAIHQLQEAHFEFPAPPHYRGGGVVCYPILWRASDASPLRVRFRRDSLRTRTRLGIDAVVEFVQKLRANMFEISLLPNTIAIIDNWFLLHGRTAFAPQAAPRHINRIYVNPPSGIS